MDRVATPYIEMIVHEHRPAHRTSVEMRRAGVGCLAIMTQSHWHEAKSSNKTTTASNPRAQSESLATIGGTRVRGAKRPEKTYGVGPTVRFDLWGWPSSKKWNVSLFSDSLFHLLSLSIIQACTISLNGVELSLKLCQTAPVLCDACSCGWCYAMHHA